MSNLISAQYDVPATLAELVGAGRPPGDGVSMLPEMLRNAGEPRPREFLYFEFPEGGGQLAVRLGRWKGVKTGLKDNRNSRWQLYDLEADTGESTDVAATHPEILKQLDVIVAREHRHAHIREWEFVDSRVPEGTR